MEISEIDELDHLERLSELQQQLDVQYSGEDSLRLVDLDPPQGSDDSNDSLGARAEEGDAMVQATRQLHLCESRRSAMELRLNHALLQVSALRTRSDQLGEELEAAYFAVAEAEEHRLLLEARLRDVSEFETGSEVPSLTRLRGDLLEAANRQLRAAAGELGRVRTQAEEDRRLLEDEARRRELEAQALREQLSALSDQIAQRTVLFSALERRWREETRGGEMIETELRDEALVCRTRLQQVERQFSAADEARLEAQLSLRQREGDIARLEEELRTERERIIAIDEELQRAAAANLGLQTTVERLRGSSLEELELEMMTEVEQLRERIRRQEEDSRRQLEDAREHLAQEARRRESLLEELHSTRRERDETRELLLSSGLEGPGAMKSSDFEEDSKLDGSGEDQREDAAFASKELERVLREEIQDCVFSEKRFLETSRLVEAFRSVVFSVASDITGDVFKAESIADEASKSLCGRCGDGNSRKNTDLDEAFLLGADQTSPGDIPTIEDTAANDMRKMSDELDELRRRETLLKKALQDQGTNMALVLRRAADFESAVAGRVRAAIEGERDKERHDLQRKLALAENEKHQLLQKLSAQEIEIALRDEELCRRCEAQERTERNMTVVERSYKLLSEALETDRETSKREWASIAQRLGMLLGADNKTGLEELDWVHALLSLTESRLSSQRESDTYNAGMEDKFTEIDDFALNEKMRDPALESHQDLRMFFDAEVQCVLNSFTKQEKQDEESIEAKLVNARKEAWEERDMQARDEIRCLLEEAKDAKNNLEKEYQSQIQLLRAKYENELLTLKSSLEQEFSIARSIHPDDREANLEAEISERVRSAVNLEVSRYRRKIHQKFKSKVAKMQSQYEQERIQILDMVQNECAVILSEAKQILSKKLKRVEESEGVNMTVASNDQEIKWYPEMISPEQTLEYVKFLIQFA